MPLYDMVCDACGAFHDGVLMSIAEHDEGMDCERCGAPTRTVIGAVAVVGPMPSKPYVLGGADVEVRSVEELRAYERENPTHRVLSKDDSWMRAHRDRARERAERVARGQGYRDWEHRQQAVAKDVRRKRELD